jgi:hypothetical protein
MRVVRVFATAVVFLLCAAFGAFVGVALRSRAALLSGSAVGLLLGAALAREAWRMPVSRASVRRTAVSRAPVSRKRRRRR